MQLYEIILLGAALSADAFAAGMSDAASWPHMSQSRCAFIALTFGLFQFLMPLLGYYCGAAFTTAVAKVAPYLSFALLAVIGGKAVIDWQRGGVAVRTLHKKARLSAGKVLLQGIATSLDALAVGVALLAQDAAGQLPVHVVLCSALIGATTLTLTGLAVRLGKAAGSRFEDSAQFWGGAVLVVIGCKLLLEGVL